MLEIPLTARRRKTFSPAFVGSAILHVCTALLIFSITFPEMVPRQLRVTPVYLAETPAPVSPPAPVLQKPAVRLLTPARIPDLPARSLSVPPPIPPPPAPFPPPEPPRPSIAILPPGPSPTLRPPDPVKPAGFGPVTTAETATPRLQPAAASSFSSASATIPSHTSDSGRVQIGSLEEPRTPAPVTPSRTQVTSAGFGTSAAGGPIRAMPGERSTGSFGDRTASRVGAETSARPPIAGTGAFASIDPGTTRPSTKPAVTQSQFGTVTAIPSASAIRPKSSDSRSASLEILQKPRPLYSDEARRLQIEGEVTLEMLFPASGPARVLRVLHGLGHGLDESATKAATGIRFRPAIEYGKPVDTVATVRIEFQLAF